MWSMFPKWYLMASGVGVEWLQFVTTHVVRGDPSMPAERFGKRISREKERSAKRECWSAKRSASWRNRTVYLLLTKQLLYQMS